MYRSGEDFDLNIDEGTQTRLDGDAVKELLGKLKEAGHITDDDIQGCFKDIDMLTIRTTRKDKNKKLPFETPNLSNATTTGLVDMLGTLREQLGNMKKLEGIYKESLQAKIRVEELVVAAKEEAKKATGG